MILRDKCFNKNEYNGAIGIYFPNGANKRFLPHSKSFDKKQLRYRVENAVINYLKISYNVCVDCHGMMTFQRFYQKIMKTHHFLTTYKKGSIYPPKKIFKKF